METRLFRCYRVASDGSCRGKSYSIGIIIEGTDKDAEMESSWATVLQCNGAVDVASVAMAELSGVVLGCYLYWCVRSNQEPVPLPLPSLDNYVALIRRSFCTI